MAFGTWSQFEELDLPLTVGRDFAGIVVSKGHNVGNKLQLGEEVWGVVPVEQQGCHANYVVVDSNLVRHLIFILNIKYPNQYITYDYIEHYFFAR